MERNCGRTDSRCDSTRGVSGMSGVSTNGASTWILVNGVRRDGRVLCGFLYKLHYPCEKSGLLERPT